MRRNTFTFATLTALPLLLAIPAQAFDITGTKGTALSATEIASFGEPWAMTFLPDGTMLVTEKTGELLHVLPDGTKRDVGNVPTIDYGGQGGLGDIVAHPDYASNKRVYLSYVEEGNGGSGAVVVSATLDTSAAQPALTDITRIWEQTPKVSSGRHFAHRIALDGNGHIFITSGDRGLQKPAQDLSGNLGKTIRLNEDGSVPADNPYQDLGELAKTFWSIGHRNQLGIDFDAQGRLWTHEMGPANGDELNLTVANDNYGWPLVSNGDNYSGVPIPDHDTAPEFNAPEAYWVPSIAPSGLVIYDGDMFANWRGDALMGGLRSQALIHVDINGDIATENERFEWGSRVREVEQGPDGAVYVLEDGGRMLKLVPR